MPRWECIIFSLQWCHNERDGISNHQPHDRLLSRLFSQRSKKTSKLRVTGFVPCGFFQEAWKSVLTSFIPTGTSWAVAMYSQWKPEHSTIYYMGNTMASDGMVTPEARLLAAMHYNDVIMSATASQITSVTIVYSTVCLDSDRRKYQSSASPAFVRGIHRWPVNFSHKGPVTRKMLPLDGVIMEHVLRGSEIPPPRTVIMLELWLSLYSYVIEWRK